MVESSELSICLRAGLPRAGTTSQCSLIGTRRRSVALCRGLDTTVDRSPKLMTYEREITRRSVLMGHILSRGTLWFSAISRQMMQGVSDIGTWRLVFNGVPLERYEFQPDPGPGAPLVFLGRIEEIKGPHLAIEVAKRAQQPLVIAGNISPEHRQWFERKISPHLNGATITYVGPVNDAEKNRLLGRARALLMPVAWDEPFGIVMAEAMACGTPIIGLARGAIPEIVEHNVTGFVCESPVDMVRAVHMLAEIDRAECRARAERLFSDAAVINAYENVYCEMRTAADA
jgi:glycosyltransferase involved in cell wall biosynthesis